MIRTRSRLRKDVIRCTASQGKPMLSYSICSGDSRPGLCGILFWVPTTRTQIKPLAVQCEDWFRACVWSTAKLVSHHLQQRCVKLQRCTSKSLEDQLPPLLSLFSCLMSLFSRNNGFDDRSHLTSFCPLCIKMLSPGLPPTRSPSFAECLGAQISCGACPAPAAESSGCDWIALYLNQKGAPPRNAQEPTLVERPCGTPQCDLRAV